jgi:glycosyltransferase involved in cell wall biosynthesis
VRVCIVTVAAYVHGIGGMQRATSDLVLGLTSAGHEVEVITARHPEGLHETTHDGALWHFLDVPTRFTRIPTQHPAWHRSSYAKFVELHRARPFDVVHSESVGALGLLQRGVNRRVLPVVVKFHGNYLGLLKASLRRARAARQIGPAVAETKHAVWLTGDWLLSRGEPYRLRACEAMVPSQQQLDDTVRSHFLRRSHVHVVPNGVDATRFAPGSKPELRSSLGLPAGPLLVGVGRLNREKGFGRAIELLARIPDASLAIVGAGEHGDDLRREAERLGVGARVLFAGSHPPDVVARYLAAGDVFLFPTERDEAAPVVLIEAMASATPVVASRLGGIPEVIGDSGEAGILVEPGDVEGLARATAGLLADETERERMGRAGRARVLAEYTVERMVERTVDVYRIAVEQWRRAANGRRAPGPE